MPNLATIKGFCTAYAHACGYLDCAAKDGDNEYITMGAEGAVYFVKARTTPQQWLTFPRTVKGAEAARKAFMRVIRETGAVRRLIKEN